MAERITGIINPIVMPFTKDGEPDIDLLFNFAEDSVTAGCSALFIMGAAARHRHKSASLRTVSSC